MGLATDGVTPLSNGNYVVRSPFWDNGVTADAGAVTWGSGTTGVAGAVSAANSLVGSTASDADWLGWRDCAEQRQLRGAQYLLGQRRHRRRRGGHLGEWDQRRRRPGVSSQQPGGQHASDQVGFYGVTALSNGNYVVSSPNWDNGAIARRRGGHLGEWDQRHRRRGLGSQQPGGQHRPVTRLDQEA